jgi:hypothetical protein
MKEKLFYKLGIVIFASWQVYYSYWWMTIHERFKTIPY